MSFIFLRSKIRIYTYTIVKGGSVISSTHQVFFSMDTTLEEWRIAVVHTWDMNDDAIMELSRRILNELQRRTGRGQINYIKPEIIIYFTEK